MLDEAPFEIDAPESLAIQRSLSEQVEVALTGPVSVPVVLGIEGVPETLSVTPTQLDLSSDVRSGVFTFYVASGAPLGVVPLRVAASSEAIAEKKLASLALEVTQAPGELDVRFGNGGVAPLPHGPPLDGSVSWVPGMVVRPDGRILAAGTGASPFLVQLDADGRPDEDFGQRGVATYPPERNRRVRWLEGFVLDSQGFAYLGSGSTITSVTEACVIRFTPSGTVDNAYGDHGCSAITDAANYRRVSLHVDDTVVALSTASVVRYLKNGDLDSAFQGGIADLSDHGFAKGFGVLDDARIVVVAQNNMDVTRRLLLLGPDGSFEAVLDDSLSPLPYGNAPVTVLPLSDGFVVGSSPPRRYLLDGSLDPSFRADPVRDVVDMAVQPDGKLLVLGDYNGQAGLIRLMEDGSADASFGDDGRIQQFGAGVAWHPDGRILVFVPNVYGMSSIDAYVP